MNELTLLEIFLGLLFGLSLSIILINWIRITKLNNYLIRYVNHQVRFWIEITNSIAVIKSRLNITEEWEDNE